MKVDESGNSGILENWLLQMTFYEKHFENAGKTKNQIDEEIKMKLNRWRKLREVLKLSCFPFPTIRCF